jgi:hypothetical protein
MFVNGVKYTRSDAGTRDTKDVNFQIGRFPTFSGRGSYQDFRATSDSKSDAWILADYRNQNDTSTFYSVGTEESAPATGIAASKRIIQT